MTTDTWLSIGLGVLTIAVLFNALVTGWMFWHYTRGMAMAEGVIDRVSPPGNFWTRLAESVNEERQDDAWVAELDAQQEANASAGIEVIPVSETDTSPDNMIVSWTFKDAIRETPPRQVFPSAWSPVDVEVTMAPCDCAEKYGDSVGARVEG